MKMAFDEVLVGVGGGALASYLIAGAASVPMVVAAPVGMLVGGLAYGLYRSSKHGPNYPGLTKDEIDTAIVASGGTMLLAMLFSGFNVKEQFTQALVKAAENAAGGTAAAATAAKTGTVGQLIFGLGTFLAGAAMVFFNVFVVGDKIAEWLQKNR